MKEDIKKLIEECESEIQKAENDPEQEKLQETKVHFLGKNGKLTSILRTMKDIPASERPQVGQLINQARERLENRFEQAENRLKAYKLDKQLKNEVIDITANVKQPAEGSLHPISIIAEKITDIFIGLGFTVEEGPEIETDYYNFKALNTPDDHPARDMQDTFYFTENLLLRTQTSPNQIRVMERKKPPIKMICPGKVYRSDDDSSHSPVFTQIEGLVVDKGVTLCDLKGCLEYLAKSIFDETTKVRFRPSYFPFTEPSVEVDLTCSSCHGKGCRLCKGTGWMEVLGAGMVHPNVLENCGIDPQLYSGFAFGVGIERLAMIRYGIPDIKLLYDNDVRFLRQFKG